MKPQDHWKLGDKWYCLKDIEDAKAGQILTISKKDIYVVLLLRKDGHGWLVEHKQILNYFYPMIDGKLPHSVIKQRRLASLLNAKIKI
jgi:hypothetical protein